MAGRNKRKSADYFSHDADSSSDEKLVYLESLFGHTGYALYFKFLEKMTRAEGFKLEWNEIKKAVYASEFHISVTEIDRFITECCRKEIKAFVIADMMLFSPGLIVRLQPLIDKREYNRQKYEDRKANNVSGIDNSVTEKANSVTETTQSKGKESKDTIYTSNFLTFWEAYPRKTGKGAAFKAYQKIKSPRPSLQEILNSVSDHNKTDQWKDIQFVPNPSTWLNQRRWEDEIEGVTPKEKISVFKVAANDR